MQKTTISVWGYEECSAQAQKLATVMDLDFQMVQVHRFPDGESLVKIPTTLPSHIILFRSLNQPNDKLIELLLTVKTARQHGVLRITLIAPYLCYMRQDVENTPGEAISQQIIGPMLAELFDDVITVDSHLHRISRLEQAIPIKNAINLLATDPIAAFISQQFDKGLVFGPDKESEQWVSELARKINFDYAVATKTRGGDKSVKIKLDEANYQQRDIIILDDIASTGRTIGLATEQLLAAGAKSVNALVTHAVFGGDAKHYLQQTGLTHLWSTNSIADETNVVDLSELIANSIQSIC